MGSPGFELESPVRGDFRTGEQEVTRAPQSGQEIPVEQVSGGVLARMRPELSVGAALPPAGRQPRGSGSPGAWHARAAWATMPG